MTTRRIFRPKDYPAEYRNWKGMMGRGRSGKYRVHSDLRTFQGFMECLGPRPHPTHSVDRKDHTDPEYACDKIQWASPKTQTQNRRNTVWFTYSGSKYPDHQGKRRTLTEWATITEQKPASMRRRKHEGWSDNENIEGARAKNTKPFDRMTVDELLDHRPWDLGKEKAQEAGYKRYASPNETRFEFLRWLHDERLDKLKTEFASVAYYLPDEGSPEEWDDCDPVSGRWGRKSRASTRRWRELVEAYSDWFTYDQKLKTRQRAWERALRRATERQRENDESEKRRARIKRRYS